MDPLGRDELSERECEAALDRLFPLGPAGEDVSAQLAPEGWARSPLLAVFHPSVEQVYREYAGQPVEFVGVDIWDRREDALAFVEQYGVSYPTGVDQKGAIAIDYGVKGIPEKFFIDQDGVVRRKFVGPMTAENLRSVLDQLMQ